jgi:hypothetical protein
MARKHNTRHPDRARSRYPGRLSKRGLSKAPPMASPENLRTAQERRARETGSPWAQATETSQAQAA